MKVRMLAPLVLLILLIAMLPTFLPTAVELKGVKASPTVVVYRTPNPGFETGIGGWNVRSNEGDLLERKMKGSYLGNFSIHFSVVNGSFLQLAEPTTYLKDNETLCMTIAAKGLRPLANSSYLEVDTMAFWSWKRMIPIHLIIALNENVNGTITYVDKSGIYIIRKAEGDGWTEYRLRLGSEAVKELMVEYLKKAYNETMASPLDEFFIRFLYLRPHNVEGYVDQVGIGYILPGVLRLEFESRSLLPMSNFVSKVLSNGKERHFFVDGSYSFTISYVEPVLAGEKLPVEVDFSTGQRVLANITLVQPRVLWV